MATHQPALLCDLEEHQWYVHMSRDDGADFGVIKSALKDLRTDCAAQNVNLGLLFGPTLLADLSDDMPDNFQPYPGYESKDGKVAKGTQEELLVWVHSDRKGLCWETQHSFRNKVKGHMSVGLEKLKSVLKDTGSGDSD